MPIIVVGINEPSPWCLCTKFVQHALASVPCFRIWGHFPSFRHSAIPPFRLLGSPLLKKAKGLTRGNSGYPKLLPSHCNQNERVWQKKEEPINSSKIEILFQRQNTSCEMGGGCAVTAVCLEGSLCTDIPIWIINKQISSFKIQLLLLLMFFQNLS